jgi:predicted metal-dependent hydrolase
MSEDATNAAARLTDRPFPTYAHTPGVTPHPIREPAGHSYKIKVPDVAPPDPSDWRTCSMYSWGIDLFNAGYYWEAHEAWEAVWIAAGRRGAFADFLKALIKLAAAGVKLREGTPAGARRHLRRAVELFDLVARQMPAPQDRCLGLKPVPLRETCEQLLSGPLPESPPRDGKPYAILKLALQPR